MKNKNLLSPPKSHLFNLYKNGKFYEKVLGGTFVACFIRNHLEKNSSKPCEK